MNGSCFIVSVSTFFFGILRQTIILSSYGNLGFTEWLVYVKPLAVFTMLVKRSSYGNIRCFDKKYQPGKITFQVSVLKIKYLVLLSTCVLFKYLVYYTPNLNCCLAEINIEKSGMHML